MDDQSNSVFHKINADLGQAQSAVSLNNLTGPASCLVVRKKCNCEASRHNEFLLQPMNSLSSLLIIFYGVYRLIRFARSQKLHNRFWDLLLVLMGLGSFFFHSRLEYWSEIWDFSGIFWVSSAGLVFFMNESVRFQKGKAPLTPLQGIGLTALIAHGLIGTMLLYPGLRTVLAAVAMLISVGVLAKRLPTFPSTWQKELKLSFFLLLSGMVCFVLDFSDPFCWPHSWFQMHSVWHLAMTYALIRLTRLIGAEES